MIDPSVWDREWAVLEARWKPMPEEVQLRYYEALDPILDDVEFCRACQAILTEREFFPRVADFFTVQAQEAFGAVMDLLPRYSSAMDTAEYRKLVNSLDPMALRTLEMLGGFSKLDEAKRGWLTIRRDWMDAWAVTVQETTGSLPSVEKRAELPPPTEDDRLALAP